MRPLTFVAGLVLLSALSGCSSDSPGAAIVSISPPRGSTAVDVKAQPRVVLADEASWALDRQNPELLLYDVTRGARQRVGGRIEIAGKEATFIPSKDLPAQHDFELVLQRKGLAGLCETESCGNDQLAENDGSEWPEEAISWPLIVRFSTVSRPSVRAVYRRDNALYVYFSQPMDRVVTAPFFKLSDQQGEQIATKPAIWTDDQGLRAKLELAQSLKVTDLYTLELARQAEAADGQRLDGNANGDPGEIDDDFQVQFTGSQGPVLLSRREALLIKSP
jgi:hypothetical protein